MLQHTDFTNDPSNDFISLVFMPPMCLDDYEHVHSLTQNSDSASRTQIKIMNLQTRLWLDTDALKDVLYCAISRHATNIMSATQTMTTDS
ncbi:hypothetical protein N7536_012094 [Penicillium majusculum]|nr:hypothetical protein N7536_012094 [Penicillium majusculum]